MLILASNSPRRKKLLSLAGWTFQVASADIDEQPLPAEDPQAYVLRLAESKARSVYGASAAQLAGDDLILAADTTVVFDGRILGKPGDPVEARQMLADLRWRTHLVYTGLAVWQPASGRMLTEISTSTIQMRNYSDAEMQVYIDSGDPLDKAGGYAIQHTSFNPVQSVSGCFANVTGLPVCLVQQCLARFGAAPAAQARLACPGLDHGPCRAETFAAELNS